MRRSSPALFELMRRGDAGSGPVRVPASAPSAPPPPPPPPSDPEPRPAGRSWVSESESPSGGSLVQALQRRMTVSVSTVLIAAGGVLALVVIVWSAAYQAGASREKEAAARDLGREAPPTVREPLADNIRVNPTLLANAEPPKPAPSSPASNPAASESPRIDGDPREPGRNYYQLITTDRDEASRLIAFLGENGVSAFASGVDRNGKPTNNPARFTVCCSRGITAEEYREKAPVRVELEQKVVVLGQRWQKELKGSTNFSGAYWNKYAP